MYDFYRQKLSDDKKKRSKKALKNLYSDIPSTSGCMENIAKVGGCGAWCCLHPSTLIHTPRGPVPIDSLAPGELVHTRLGLREIVKVAKFPTNKKCFEVITRYGRSITLTEDHKLLSWVGRKDRYQGGLEWLEASALFEKKSNKKGCYIFFPRMEYNAASSKMKLLDTLNGYVRDDRFYSSSRCTGSSLPASFEVTEDFAWLIGIYLAEGSIGDSVVEFHLHEKEVAIFRILSIISTSFSCR